MSSALNNVGDKPVSSADQTLEGNDDRSNSLSLHEKGAVEQTQSAWKKALFYLSNVGIHEKDKECEKKLIEAEPSRPFLNAKFNDNDEVETGEIKNDKPVMRSATWKDKLISTKLGLQDAATYFKEWGKQDVLGGFQRVRKGFARERDKTKAIATEHGVVSAAGYMLGVAPVICAMNLAANAIRMGLGLIYTVGKAVLRNPVLTATIASLVGCVYSSVILIPLISHAFSIATPATLSNWKIIPAMGALAVGFVALYRKVMSYAKENAKQTANLTAEIKKLNEEVKYLKTLNALNVNPSAVRDQTAEKEVKSELSNEPSDESIDDNAQQVNSSDDPISSWFDASKGPASPSLELRHNPS